ncbi:MAG: hypothetical protein HN366_02930 [Deltaproteobacteria bacterium]|jgi:uncharacterized membrane protein YqiK|nr:hypothetical protein [Deltaproteobacteria bacterium]
MITTYIIVGIALIVLGTWEKSPFRVYWKTEPRIAFVRTGFGGSKAVVGRGAFVIPLLHKIQWVDLSETKLQVQRKDENSIITKNRLRADMEMEVYVRVKADKKDVEQAAIALGQRAGNTDALGRFLAPALLNAVQAVASDMALEEIHQNRNAYATGVKTLLVDELNQKGLELTSISLCSFEQTKIEFYDPDNVFDSEGILAIKGITEKRKKERNDIEQDNNILIQEKNVEARKQSLDLEKERAFAEQDVKNEIESQKEERERELTQHIMNQRLLAEDAKLKHDRGLKELQLSKEKTDEEQRIEKERAVETAQINKQKEIEEHKIEIEKSVQATAMKNEIELVEEKRKKEEANIELSRKIQSMKIAEEKDITEQRMAKDLEIKMAEVDTSKTLEAARLSIQEARSMQEEANALAMIGELQAKAKMEDATHEMLSVKVKSQAEREKTASTIRAEMAAAIEKIQEDLKVEMESQRIRQLAKAKSDATNNEAQAIERLSDANQKDALVKAEAERAMIEARNVISEPVLKDARMGQLIGEISDIVGALMKPAEKIDSIKIVNVDGMGGVAPHPRVEGEGDQSLVPFGGTSSAIGTIIHGMLQVGAFKPVFRQLFGSEEMGDLDLDRAIKLFKDMVPGLIEDGAKSYVRETVKRESRKMEKEESKKEES